MKKADEHDIKIVAQLLFDMYQEVQPTLASKEISLYFSLARKYILNNDVWLDENSNGLFIMKNESIDVLNQKLWNGVAVYIKPSHRKTKLLKSFYDFMFENYDGTIMGFTDVNSEHNKVLMKRHKLLGYVYELNRS